MSALGFQCAWCARPLVDREHAIEHGPVCEKSPVVAAVRSRTTREVIELVADLLDEEAWSYAMKAPAGPGRESYEGAVLALSLLAGDLREKFRG